MRYVSAEGGQWRQDFDQRPVVVGKDGWPKRMFPDELGVGEIAQALLVAPARNRRLKIPTGTPAEPRLAQTRQSRITAALDGGDPEFAYRPAGSDYPDIGVRFDRANAAGSLAARSLDSQPTLATAKRRKTTTPLSGQPPLEPTHRLVDLNVPFGTVAVALDAGPSEFKLATLTNGEGGLTFPASRRHYRGIAAARRQQTTAKSTPSPDPHPEISW